MSAVARWCACASLCLLLIGCGGGHGLFDLGGGTSTRSAPPSVAASLSGVVRDSVTTQPLANVTVVFGGNSQMTGSDGRFNFQNISVVRRSPPLRASSTRRQQTTGNSVSLSIALSQYDCKTVELDIGTGAIAAQDVALTPHPGSATVSGIVRDAASQSVLVDASVVIGTGTGIGQAAREARTDNHGAFLVSGIETGRQQLIANASGYVTSSQILDNLAGGVTFPLPAPIDMLLAGTTITVSGTVRDEDGNGLGSASIRVGTLSTVSQPSGFYQLSGVSVGLQTFSFSAPGFLTATFSLQITGSQGQVNVVLFRSGVNPPTAPFTVRGRITVQGATDSGGVTVSALEQPGNIIRDTMATGADGRYTLFIPEGNYLIRAEKPGFATVTRSVTVPPGGQIVDNVDILLVPGS